MAPNRQPAGSSQGGQWAPSTRADDTAMGNIKLNPDYIDDDLGLPVKVDGYTTDFGTCPCGDGRLVQSDIGLTRHEEGYEGYCINCSETGDLIGGCDYVIDETTGELLDGNVYWYDTCSNEDQSR